MSTQVSLLLSPSKNTSSIFYIQDTLLCRDPQSPCEKSEYQWASQLAFSSSTEGRHGPVFFSGNKSHFIQNPRTGSPDGATLMEREILSQCYWRNGPLSVMAAVLGSGVLFYEELFSRSL